MEPPDPASRRMSRALIVTIVTALAIAGMVAGVGNLAILAADVAGRFDVRGSDGGPGPARYQPGRPIVWSTCADHELRRLHARCGFLTVPLNWSKRHGAVIRLAVSRITHTATAPRGVMVVNPGGPGGSGLATVDVSGDLPSSVAGLYDWVGFDPRGVGDSIPALHCDTRASDGPRPGYSPTAAHIAAWTARAKSYAAACARNGPILAHMTTVDSARDIEALRLALGQDRIDYYGFSYGTYLGQTYATLFPDRVGLMVLDSTEDPRSVDDQYGFAQDEAFEIAMDRYFAWVADWDTVYHLGRTARAVRHRFDVARAALAAHPVRQVGADEWDDLFLDAAYSQSDWPDLTDVLTEQLEDPDPADLEDAFEAYGQTDDGGTAAFLAVECTDGRVDPSVPTMLAAVRREAAIAPLTAWGDAWAGLPCNFWPAPPARRAFHVDGSHVRSVLMIDETLDAPTPYSGSLHVRSLFPGARLIAEPGGTSHAQTPDADAPCVFRYLVDYLATGALPARVPGAHADATCAPAPTPVPDE